MAEATVKTAVFPRFQALAAELRNQIWGDTLPEEIEPALVFYQPGCWRAEGAEPDLDLLFEHELLNVHIELPVAFVNKEARSIVQAYIRRLGLATKARSHQDAVFTRKFNPTVDAIYIKPNQLIDLITDIYGRMAQPDVQGQVFSPQSAFPRIAMSAATLREEIRTGGLPELMFWFTSINEVLVVLDAPLGLECAKEYPSRVQLGWRFVSAPGDAFCWSGSQQRFERCKEYGHVRDESVSLLVETEALAAQFAKSNLALPQFKVRPVFARSFFE
jgi:hypothetical protein